MPLRETRRFKTKGFVISFGDLMLPLVGLVAIGLLMVAGKIFFFSGFQTDSQPIPVSVTPVLNVPMPPSIQISQNAQSTQGDSDTPRADASEGAPHLPERPAGPGTGAQSAASDGNLVLDLARNNDAQDSIVVVSVPADSGAAVASQGNSGAREDIIVNTSPPPQPAPAPTRVSRPAAPEPTTPEGEARPQPRPAVVAARPPVQPRPVQPVQSTPWRVQVGAYSTKAAADSVVRDLARAGHTAAVVSGRLHKVLVQAGSTRQEAHTLAARLQAGYPGAFVVTP